LLLKPPTCSIHSVTSSVARTRTRTCSVVVRLSQQNYWDEDDYDYEEVEEVEEGQDYDSSRETLEWERCTTDAGTAHILLPPRSVSLPTCVLHFTGGTFFGSAPQIWYRQLLEDIVKHTQAVVVATSIPVTLLQSPLEHTKLSRKLQHQFQTAWREVLVDEYGESIQNVPVCGMGHSLGARLLVVLSTLNLRNQITPPTKAMILLSFTNFGATAGIPGVEQLRKARQRIKKTTDEPQDEFWQDEDVEWGDLVEELQDVVSKQASRVTSALTPSSRQLEFVPTPAQLWKAVAEDERYKVPHTLIVQFDDDKVDQSSKLATALVESSNVKFARLRGMHLTPVSASAKEDKSWLDVVNSRAERVLMKLLAGNTRQQSTRNKETLRNLRQTMARYVTEVVTKD
jgi:hypothetical protein